MNVRARVDRIVYPAACAGEWKRLFERGSINGITCERCAMGIIENHVIRKIDDWENTRRNTRSCGGGKRSDMSRTTRNWT